LQNINKITKELKMHSKRISTEIVGDNAIKADIIYVSIGLAGESKKDADSKFCALAIACVEKTIRDCKNATGIEYPSHSQIINFIEKNRVDSEKQSNP